MATWRTPACPACTRPAPNPQARGLARLRSRLRLLWRGCGGLFQPMLSRAAMATAGGPHEAVAAAWLAGGAEPSGGVAQECSGQVAQRQAAPW